MKSSWYVAFDRRLDGRGGVVVQSTIEPFGSWVSVHQLPDLFDDCLVALELVGLGRKGATSGLPLTRDSR